MRSLKVERILCLAIAKLFDEDLDEKACDGNSFTNRRATVRVTVTASDRVAGTYELELFGKSSELALRRTWWVERHKFFVALGLNASLEPIVLVADFEPMVRTTPELYPEQSELFEYISLQHESALRTFQDKVRYAISSAVQAADKNSSRRRPSDASAPDCSLRPVNHSVHSAEDRSALMGFEDLADVMPYGDIRFPSRSAHDLVRKNKNGT